MARAFLKVYFDFDERTDELSDAERARLLLAMYYYAKTGEKKPLTGNERFLFSTFKGEIDRDIANYNAKVANGGRGGRPAMINQTETEENQEEPKKTETNLNLKNKTKNKTKNKDITNVISCPTATDTDRLFDKFWGIYPRHEGKAAARKAFDKLKADDAMPETLIGAILKQKQSEQWSDPRFIPHPATWLNGHRWEDEPIRNTGGRKRVQAQQYEQRDYSEADLAETVGATDLFR